MTAPAPPSRPPRAAATRRAGASLGTLFLTVFLDLLGFGLVIPFLPGDGAPARRRRLRRDHARRRLLGHAVPLHPDLGPAVGSDRAPAGAALEHRRDRRRDGVPGRWRRRCCCCSPPASSAASPPPTSPSRRPTSPTSRRPSSARAAWASSGSPSASASSSGPFIGGELSRFPILGREGTLPRFVAAGLVDRSTSCSRCARCPNRCRPSAAASRCGARRRSTSRPCAPPSRVPGVGAAVAINFAMVLWFAGMEQTFRLFTADGFGMSDAATGTSSASSASSA